MEVQVSIRSPRAAPGSPWRTLALLALILGGLFVMGAFIRNGMRVEPFTATD